MRDAGYRPPPSPDLGRVARGTQVLHSSVVADWPISTARVKRRVWGGVVDLSTGWLLAWRWWLLGSCGEGGGGGRERERGSRRFVVGAVFNI